MLGKASGRLSYERRGATTTPDLALEPEIRLRWLRDEIENSVKERNLTGWKDYTARRGENCRLRGIYIDYRLNLLGVRARVRIVSSGIKRKRLRLATSSWSWGPASAPSICL